MRLLSSLDAVHMLQHPYQIMLIGPNEKKNFARLLDIAYACNYSPITAVLACN